VIQRVSLLLQISLNDFSGNIGQLLKVCKMLSKELKHTLFREGFSIIDETIYEEKIEEDPNEEDLDETYDEDEVSALPLDEDIQTFAPPTHQEDNMMIYNPFENFDDALFHDCGNEEKIQKDLDEVSLAEGLNKTLSSIVPFEEDEVIQSCEEVINFYDANEIMEQPPDTFDHHIDDFIQIGRCRWDLGCFIFYEDPYL
jgi:hypothetical protein